MKPRTPLRVLAILAITAATGCGAHEGGMNVSPLANPSGVGSETPNVFSAEDGTVYMSWLEAIEDTLHALRFSRWDGDAWTPVKEVARGSSWFVNWADFPSVVGSGDRSLTAHWLEKSGADTYAYDVRIARSPDAGRTWSDPVTPHRDGTRTEHGFVSMLPAVGGDVFVTWLDGRKYAQEERAGASDHDAHGVVPAGEMSLRAAWLSPAGAIRDEVVLDERTCDCCQTSAAWTQDGIVVVYRDRTDDEVRDIGVVTYDGRSWSPPGVVGFDGWKIDACPVNGPAVDAVGDETAVAWFTMPLGSPAIRVSFSRDGGRSFTPPVRIDDGSPMGRVDVALVDGAAYVSWMETVEDGAEIRVRRVESDGSYGPSVTVTRSSAGRSAGFPRMARGRGGALLAWTVPGDPPKVEASWIAQGGTR